MKISFLVTYYQQVHYVRESMESLLALEKPGEWEILIGDDGSADGTREAAQAYVDRDPEHIRLYVMDREPGKKYLSVDRASRNRLNLVARASGDAFCLMDGDDFYSETDFIPQALSLLETNPGVSVIGFDTWKYREGQTERRKRGGSSRPVPVSRDRYLRWDYTHAGACVFRRNMTPERMKMLSETGSFDDNDIVLNALAGGELIRVHRPVYAYRQAEAGASVYTEMNPAERASLNLWAMGAGLKYMGPGWEKPVTARFATAVWMAWFLRKNLRDQMDPVRYRFYLEACRRAEFTPGERLMRYPELTENERRELDRWVRRVGRESPPRVVYAWTQTRGHTGKG